MDMTKHFFIFFIVDLNRTVTWRWLFALLFFLYFSFFFFGRKEDVMISVLVIHFITDIAMVTVQTMLSGFLTCDL